MNIRELRFEGSEKVWKFYNSRGRQKLCYKSIVAFLNAIAMQIPLFNLRNNVFSGMYTSTNNSIILSVLNKLFSFDSVDVLTFLMAFALFGKTSGTVNSPMRL